VDVLQMVGFSKFLEESFVGFAKIAIVQRRQKLQGFDQLRNSLAVIVPSLLQLANHVFFGNEPSANGRGLVNVVVDLEQGTALVSGSSDVVGVGFGLSVAIL
jgi:hypothetical protein